MDTERGMNIILEYPIKVLFAPALETIIFGKPGAEVFKDEHGFQWIKFYAKNGPTKGQETMIRADEVVIARDE
jgi:hypothetical protein